MRFSRITKWIIGSGLVLSALTLGLVWFFHVPAREISLGEFKQLLQAQGIAEVFVAPTPYSGIYHLRGTRKTGAGKEKVFVTTHLDEAQVKEVFAQKGVTIELPGQ